MAIIFVLIFNFRVRIRKNKCPDKNPIPDTIIIIPPGTPKICISIAAIMSPIKIPIPILEKLLDLLVAELSVI